MNEKRQAQTTNTDLSFAEILESMNEQGFADTTPFEKTENQTENLVLQSSPFNTELIVNTPVFRFTQSHTSLYNKHQTKENPALNLTPFKLKAEGMTQEQFKSYEFLFYSMDLPVLKAHQLLPEKFNQSQLKKAFKIAALKQHPDTGGTHESFLELKKSYEILMDFVKTKLHARTA